MRLIFSNSFKRSSAMILVFTLVFTFLCNPIIISAEEVVGKATVGTQKELDSALKNSKIQYIVIKTNKKEKLTIPKKSYPTKRVYVKAPNATIKNNGKFKSVNMYVSSQSQLDKALANSTIKFSYLTISTRSTDDFVIKGDVLKVGLLVKAPNATIINDAKFKSVNVFVNSQSQLDKALKDSKVTTVTISTTSKGNFTIAKGEYPNVKLVITAPNSTVTNNATFKETVVNEGTVTVPEAEVTPTPNPVDPGNGGGGNGGGNGGGPSVPETTPTPPVVTPDPTPSIPLTPLEPSVPVVTPTPEIPLTPLEPSTPVVTPTPEPSDDLDELKATYIEEIRKEADKLFEYMTYNEWNDFNNGLVNEFIDATANATSVKELKDNHQNRVDSIIRRQEATERFVNNTPIFMNVIHPDELEGYSDSLTADGKYYEFTTYAPSFGIEKDYYVPVEYPSYINTMTFKNGLVNAVSGSAITFNIKAWNNLNGAEDVVGIYVLEDSDVEGQYNIGDELIYGEHYQITENSIIIDGSVTSDLELGLYGFFVKTKVPYLDIESSGNYIYYNIVK